MSEQRREELRSARAVVITVSDRAARGEREDTSGPLAAELLAAGGHEVSGVRVVADGADSVRAALIDALRDGHRVVVTTGGTGVMPYDRTPEGTVDLLDHELPGVAEQIRAHGLAKTPLAGLSRGLVGVVDAGGVSPEGALVANLPGSNGGVRDGLEVLVELVPHVLQQLDFGDH